MLELNKIHLGDSYELIKQFGDQSIDLILIDPPYGIDQANGTNGYGQSKNRRYCGEWDNVTPTKDFYNHVLRVGKTVLIFGAQYITDLLPQSNHWLVWDKIGEMKVQNPFSECELIWTNIIDRVVCKKYFVRQQGFINDGDERIHPTQKPLRLISALINDFSKQGEIVLDCFSGSGTTCIAAKELGRDFIGIEIDPNYYKMSIERLNGISKNGQLSIFSDLIEREPQTNIDEFLHEEVR